MRHEPKQFTPPAAKPIPTVEETLTGMLGRIRVIPDSESEAIQRDERERAHKSVVDALRQRWDAPRRHFERQDVSMAGQWGKTLLSMREKVGKGMTWSLCGTRGNGKTQMAVELMRYVTELGMTAKYVTAVRFFSELKQSYRKDSLESELHIIARYRKPKLLVIDEIGKRGETEWEANLLFELLNNRYADMTDTIVIANLTPEKMVESLGPSISDRINEGKSFINCDWPTRR